MVSYFQHIAVRFSQVEAGILRKVFRVLVLFLVPSLVSAQEVQFTASAKPVVAIGETFTLSFVLNAQGNGFRGPNIQGFDVLSGPNTSTTSSIRSISGRTTMSITYTYSYIMQASREGTFEIPAATVTVDHKTYTSNTLTIKVVKNPNGGDPQYASGNRNTAPSSQRPSESDSPGATLGSGDVYVKAFASNYNPLQGEGIVVTYKIYTKIPIAQINISKLSSFSGFWSQNLMKENDKLQQTTQVIHGEQYVVADIRKIALFPLKSGRLVIDPLELECVAQVRKQTRSRTGDPFFDDFFNDSFFNNNIANVEKNLKSNSLAINVRPLPESGKPTDFNGAVGSFAFRSEIDKTHLKTNEAVTLKLSVSGKGNIQLIDKLDIVFPPDFETYDPKITSDIQTTSAGVSGTQTFEYLMIPRKPGKFAINPVTFTYYDIDKKQYRSIKSPAYTLEVEKGSGDGSAMVAYSGANKEEIQYIGSDIRHIQDKMNHLRKRGTLFFNSTGFWLLLIFPLLLFAILVMFFRKISARRSDVQLMKNLKATKIARKRLAKAEQYQKAGNQDAFYVEISQALWGYISDKFTIPMADLSIGSVQEALELKNVSKPIIAQFIDTLNNSDYARFAPGEKSLNMERIYNEALGIITKIERELR